MKKLLIATTALVSTAGFAAADVSLSGRAEMGIFKTSAVDAQFFTDIDVTFTMSGETDNGLIFGASVDLDEGGAVSNATQDNSDDGGATMFVSGGFGTVTMGDTDGALDWAMTEAGNVGNPGSIADDETSHKGYLGSYLDGANSDGQILRWNYTSGAWGVAVSLEDDNGSQAANTDIGYAIGFKYSMDLSGTTVKFGLGYQQAAGAIVSGQTDQASAAGVSVSANFANGLSAGVTYTDYSDSVNDNHYSVGLGYTTGAISVHANYGQYSGAGTRADQDGFGLAAAYDLGGGALVHLGYGSGDELNAAKTATTHTSKTVSLGLGLSF